MNKKELIYKVSETFNGNHDYATAIEALNERMKISSPLEKRAEEIFKKIHEFYVSEKDTKIYETLMPTKLVCEDKSVNLLMLYCLNDVNAAQFIADDLALYHTSLALTDHKGRIVRHLEPTNPKGYEHNLYEGKKVKGQTLSLEGTIDTIKCQKAIDTGNKIYALSILAGIIERTPNILNAYHSRGRLLYEQGSYDLAAKDFKSILKQIPKNPEANLSLALTYLNMHKDPIKLLQIAAAEAERLKKEYPNFSSEFEQVIAKARIKLDTADMFKELKEIGI